MTSTPPRSPVPQEVSAELRRVAERWRVLSPAQAAAAAPLVHALLADLAKEAAPGADLPDLGPAAVPDQLAVLVHDACGAGAPGVHERLTALRRSLPC